MPKIATKSITKKVAKKKVAAKKKVVAKVVERSPAQEILHNLLMEFPKLPILNFNFIHEKCFSFKTITYQGAVRIEKYLLGLGLPAYREENHIFVSEIRL